MLAKPRQDGTVEKAYIENANCATVGIHFNCPNWRKPAHLYLCECDTPEINKLRQVCPGFTSPDPLPTVISD